MTDISSFSILELKALAFDEQEKIKAAQANLQTLYQRLTQLLKEDAEKPLHSDTRDNSGTD